MVFDDAVVSPGTAGRLGRVVRTDCRAAGRRSGAAVPAAFSRRRPRGCPACTTAASHHRGPRFCRRAIRPAFNPGDKASANKRSRQAAQRLPGMGAAPREKGRSSGRIRASGWLVRRAAERQSPTLGNRGCHPRMRGRRGFRPALRGAGPVGLPHQR